MPRALRVAFDNAARIAAVGLLIGLAACRSAERAAVRKDAAAALPALRPLDEAHAAELRAAFDGAADRPRYVVALSPT